MICWRICVNTNTQLKNNNDNYITITIIIHICYPNLLIFELLEYVSVRELYNK